MPVQVIPPMYRMLADEVKWAVADVGSQRFHFDRYRLTLLTSAARTVYFYKPYHILSSISSFRRGRIIARRIGFGTSD